MLQRAVRDSHALFLRQLLQKAARDASRLSYDAIVTGFTTNAGDLLVQFDPLKDRVEIVTQSDIVGERGSSVKVKVNVATSELKTAVVFQHLGKIARARSRSGDAVRYFNLSRGEAPRAVRFGAVSLQVTPFPNTQHAHCPIA